MNKRNRKVEMNKSMHSGYLVHHRIVAGVYLLVFEIKFFMNMLFLCLNVYVGNDTCPLVDSYKWFLSFYATFLETKSKQAKQFCTQASLP